MRQIGTSRRFIPAVAACLAGAGALAVLGYLASVFIREEIAIAALRSSDAARRAEAAATLGELGTVRAIPALLDCERPEDGSDDMERVEYTREPAYAFAALDRIIQRGAAAEIVRRSRDARPANRLWAALALGRIDGGDDEACRALEALIEDKDASVVRAAAASLVRFGGRATPRLVELLRHADRWAPDDGSIEYAVQRALIRLGPLAWPAVEGMAPGAFGDLPDCDWILKLEHLDAGYWTCAGEELARRLANASSEIEAQVASSLSSLSLLFGNHLQAAELAPALEKLLDHANPRLRQAAVYALRWSTGAASETMLRVALDLAREGVPDEAEDGPAARFWAFCHIAPTGLAALRPLLRPLERADPERYELLLRTLAESEAHFPAALTLLEERGVRADTLPKPPASSEAETSPAEWLERVRGEDLDAHAAAIQRLRWHEPAPADLPLLERALADPDPAVRAVAAHVIGKLGPAARGSTTALEGVLSRDCLTVRLHAALALCRLGAARPDLERVFREAQAEKRLRGHGVEGLVRLRVGEPSKLRELLLDDGRDGLAGLAFDALESMGAGAAPAVPLLRELARDPAGERAGLAVRALASIGPEASAAAPELERYARHAPSMERPLALWALRAVNRTGDAAAVHAAALLDTDDDVSYAAATGLIELAPHAAGAVPLLIACLRRNHRALHASAILSRIGAPAIPALLAALDGADADLRAWAAWTLGGMAEQAAGAVEALEQRLRDADEIARAAAGHALGLIGKPAARSLPALEGLQQDGSALVRRQASAAMRRLRDAAAWRPGPRGLPPEHAMYCGNAILDEQGSFHAAVCARHGEP